MTTNPPSFALLRLAVLVILVAAAGAVMVVLGTERIKELLEDAAASPWGVLAFILAYVLLVVLMVPGTIGTVTAGAALGFSTGFPVAMLGATIGSTIAFFVSRTLGRDGSQQLLGERLTSIDGWLGDNDFVSIVILRLMPIVPFNLLNYAAGLTAMRPSRYVAGSVVGLLPGTALATFAASRANDPSSAAFLISAGVLAATVVGSTYAARRYAMAKVPES